MHGTSQCIIKPVQDGAAVLPVLAGQVPQRDLRDQQRKGKALFEIKP